MAPGRQRRETKAPLRDAVRGTQLAGGIIDVLGGLGRLVYPGGVAGAIDDAVRRGPGESERDTLSADATSELRRQIASRSWIDPETGAVMPLEQPATSQALAPSGAGQAGVRPVARPGGSASIKITPMRGDYENWYESMASQDPRVTPDMVKGQLAGRDMLRSEGGRGYRQGTEIAIPIEGVEAPQPMEEPTAEKPLEKTVDQFVAALRRAQKAGNLEEARRWSAMAFIQNKLKIPDLTPSQRRQLEAWASEQTSRMTRPTDPRPLPTRFDDIYARMAMSGSIDEVNSLLRLAQRMQPRPSPRGRGYAASPEKTREMERIESLAMNKREELGKGFPVYDAGIMADLGAKDALKSQRAARAKLYEPIAKTKGPRRPYDRAELLRRARSLKNAIDRALSGGGSDPGIDTARSAFNVAISNTGMPEGMSASEAMGWAEKQLPSLPDKSALGLAKTSLSAAKKALEGTATTTQPKPIKMGAQVLHNARQMHPSSANDYANWLSDAEAVIANISRQVARRERINAAHTAASKLYEKELSGTALAGGNKAALDSAIQELNTVFKDIRRLPRRVEEADWDKYVGALDGLRRSLGATRE